MIDKELLAKNHNGMRMSLTGAFLQIKNILRSEGESGYVWTLEEVEKHLKETAKRYYDGDMSAMDEFFQLYCLDQNRPK